MSDAQLKSIIERRIEGLPQIGRERFEYEPLTGLMRYKDPGPAAFNTLKGYRAFKRKFLGKIAGSRHADGYLTVSVQGRSILAHRLIWAIVTGRDPGVTIDHRNGNRSDNRWDNLREATRSQNAMNRRARSDCRSGVPGVHWHGATGKWAAEITIGGHRQHLGLFEEKQGAQAARAKAALSLHGEFAAQKGVSLADRGGA